MPQLSPPLQRGEGGIFLVQRLTKSPSPVQGGETRRYSLIMHQGGEERQEEAWTI